MTGTPRKTMETTTSAKPLKLSLKVMLICGILASPLLFVTDILASALYSGYSFTAQAISELFAIGAPTTGLVVPLFTAYDLLLLIFACGVWRSAVRNRPLRVSALMLVGNAVNGLLLWNVFPMHMRGVEATFSDTMHIGLSGLGVIFVLLAILTGTVAFRNWFRSYSIVTVLVLVVPSMVVFFLYVPQVAANAYTPWTGLAERISTNGCLLWQAVLAVVLLRARKREPAS